MALRHLVTTIVNVVLGGYERASIVRGVMIRRRSLQIRLMNYAIALIFLHLLPFVIKSASSSSQRALPS